MWSSVHAESRPRPQLLPQGACSSRAPRSQLGPSCLVLREVDGHLELLHLESAPLVELDVVLRAVEDELVAAHLLGDELEVLDDLEPQALPPHVLVHNHILHVPHKPTPPDELVLHQQGRARDDLVGRELLSHNDEVAPALAHLLELLKPHAVRHLRRLGELREQAEVPLVVVPDVERPPEDPPLGIPLELREVKQRHYCDAFWAA
mmetsp:Transcript_7403/g.18496  ORF Transcript_7403/g.18496 Transcript_7403/m.18496 type:complete len:206 (+) Transcript_7403:43-660(+)